MTSPVEEPAKKRILVIEDEPDIVRGIRDALEFEGFEVQSRGTGAEGRLYFGPTLQAVRQARAHTAAIGLRVVIP